MHTYHAPSYHEVPSQSSRSDEYTPGSDIAALLAERLAQPRNLDEVIEQFDRGDSPVCNSISFTPKERNVILQAGREALHRGDWTLPFTPNQQEAVRFTFENFQAIMSKEPSDSDPLYGKLFTEDMEEFLEAGLPWAAHIDEKIKQHIKGGHDYTIENRGVDELLMGSSDKKIDTFSRRIWRELSDRAPLDIAWYLAERSQYSEDLQRERLESDVAEAKQAIRNFIEPAGKFFGLSEETMRRIYVQLHRSDVSSYDPLRTKKTQENKYEHTRASYIEGTLRIEMRLGGTILHPTEPIRPLEAITHELYHSISAQDENDDYTWNLGLRSGELGRDANEGMTEFLKKATLGYIEETDGIVVDTEPPIMLPDKDSGELLPHIAYKEATGSMITLMNTDINAFETLLQAYFGVTSDQEKLSQAFSLFDKEMEKYRKPIKADLYSKLFRASIKT